MVFHTWHENAMEYFTLNRTCCLHGKFPMFFPMEFQGGIKARSLVCRIGIAAIFSFLKNKLIYLLTYLLTSDKDHEPDESMNSPLRREDLQQNATMSIAYRERDYAERMGRTSITKM